MDLDDKIYLVTLLKYLPEDYARDVRALSEKPKPASLLNVIIAFVFDGRPPSDIQLIHGEDAWDVCRTRLPSVLSRILDDITSPFRYLCILTESLPSYFSDRLGYMVAGSGVSQTLDVVASFILGGPSPPNDDFTELQWGKKRILFLRAIVEMHEGPASDDLDKNIYLDALLVHLPEHSTELRALCQRKIVATFLDVTIGFLSNAYAISAASGPYDDETEEWIDGQSNIAHLKASIFADQTVQLRSLEVVINSVPDEYKERMELVISGREDLFNYIFAFVLGYDHSVELKEPADIGWCSAQSGFLRAIIQMRCHMVSVEAASPLSVSSSDNGDMPFSDAETTIPLAFPSETVSSPSSSTSVTAPAVSQPTISMGATHSALPVSQDEDLQTQSASPSGQALAPSTMPLLPTTPTNIAMVPLAISDVQPEAWLQYKISSVTALHATYRLSGRGCQETFSVNGNQVTLTSRISYRESRALELGNPGHTVLLHKQDALIMVVWGSPRKGSLAFSVGHEASVTITDPPLPRLAGDLAELIIALTRVVAHMRSHQPYANGFGTGRIPFDIPPSDFRYLPVPCFTYSAGDATDVRISLWLLPECIVWQTGNSERPFDYMLGHHFSSLTLTSDTAGGHLVINARKCAAAFEGGALRKLFSHLSDADCVRVHEWASAYKHGWNYWASGSGSNLKMAKIDIRLPTRVSRVAETHDKTVNIQHAGTSQANGSCTAKHTGLKTENVKSEDNDGENNESENEEDEEDEEDEDEDEEEEEEEGDEGENEN